MSTIDEHAPRADDHTLSADDHTLSAFGGPTRQWFEATFDAPTEVQRRGWPAIADGGDTLLIAPTGSGKTLAAFLYAIDRCQAAASHEQTADGWRVLYVSPLKALVYDIERNLRAPLLGIAEHAAPARAVQVDVRTGDTPQRDRRRMDRRPGDILVTTPESLYLILGSKASRHLATLHTVIIDEIHALAPSKRGSHLALSIERVQRLTAKRPQRIGLSATVNPPEIIGHFLTGGGPMTLIDASAAPRLDVRIVVPLRDMRRPDLSPPEPEDLEAIRRAEAGERAPRRSIWQVIEPRVLDLIASHRSTIVFVNSRGLAERMAQRLNERWLLRGSIAGEDRKGDLVKAHHGSISHAQRRLTEEALKGGSLRGIVATSSLELGIDMGAVDLVVQIEAPHSTASGLQRVGRAGHGVGQISKGRIFPKMRADLLEAAVVARLMLQGRVEPIKIPDTPLDVLAQQIVAICADRALPRADLAGLIRGAWPYRELSDSVLGAVLDMLSGRYPSTEFADLRPRLIWDRLADTLTGRKGARLLATINGGTIPDRGLFGVFLLGDGTQSAGRRVGELDEEMVYESRPGDTFILGASTWRVMEITRDQVIVEPAPGEPGRLPFWHGEGPGRPLETGRAIGALSRRLAEMLEGGEDTGDAEDDGAGEGATDADRWLADDYPLDAHARENLLALVGDQLAATGQIPSDTTVVIERFQDAVGDWLVCLLSPLGRRVHGPWAVAIQAALAQESGFDVKALWTDDGICLRFADTEADPGALHDALLPTPRIVEERIVQGLYASPLFAAQFRENAARALLLPRQRPAGRRPLWQQRLKAQNLLAVARRYPDFPIVLETYRACMQDVFDLPALKIVLAEIASGKIRVHNTTTQRPSPFATRLAFAYAAHYIYDGDAPTAERRAHALHLDRHLLGELLGDTQLRELLDADVILAVESALQATAPERKVTGADGLHDLLRRIGELSAEEIALRFAGSDEDTRAALKRLEGAHRVVCIGLGSSQGRPMRWIAVEDAGLYRDALGATIPSDVPSVFLEPPATPLRALLLRYAHTHGPFLPQAPALRWGITAQQVRGALDHLADHTPLVLRGAFMPGQQGEDYVAPDVLSRIRRLTLVGLRAAVAAVSPRAFARFLADWHRLPAPGHGPDALHDALLRLEGLSIHFSALEGRLLPARVAGFHPGMLDALGMTGEWVWVGRGPTGQRGGRVALYRRSEAGFLLRPVESPPEAGPGGDRILDALATRGACFEADLRRACADHFDGADRTSQTGRADHADHTGRADLTGQTGRADLTGRGRPTTRAALEALMWQGRITNDTFGALRDSAARPVKQSTAARSRSRARPRPRPQFRPQIPGARQRPARAGRWTLVQGPSGLLREGDFATDTEHAHALVASLLERYGVVAREMAIAEGIPGGFGSIYPILKAMEEAGKVRRGLFVEGLSGAQFASPAAVERLRDHRLREGRNTDPAANPSVSSPAARLLSTEDPANPWGSIFRWPASATGKRPARRDGAMVVLVDGALALYITPKGNSLLTFGPMADDEAVAVAAFTAVNQPDAGQQGARSLIVIDTVDGHDPRRTPWEPLLQRAGFTPSHRGMIST